MSRGPVWEAYARGYMRGYWAAHGDLRCAQEESTQRWEQVRRFMDSVLGRWWKQQQNHADFEHPPHFVARKQYADSGGRG